GPAGLLTRPTHGGQLDRPKEEAATEPKTSPSDKDRADGLQNMLDVVQKDKAHLQKQLNDTSAKASESDKNKDDLQKKLEAAIGKENGTVSTEGGEIHLKLVDKVLFATGDDQLTKSGKAVLDKVAATLKDKDPATRAIPVK